MTGKMGCQFRRDNFDNKFLLMLVVILLISSCTRTPQIRTWSPWIRTLRSGQEIKVGAKIKIVISGKTDALLGNEALTQENINEQLRVQLERRGFVIVSDSADYSLIFTYKTERGSEFEIESMASSDVQSTYGLSVGIARAIANSSVQSSSASRTVIKNNIAYNHTISAEIYDGSRSLAWKGESTWHSTDPDIIAEAKPALKLIISTLPSDPSILPSVPELKEDRALNYYKLEIENHWFSCPALPYKISFGSPPLPNSLGYGSRRNISSESIGYRVKDVKALAAYVDLVQTAEYSIPEGGGKWSNPLDSSLWKKVLLGARYYLGSDTSASNIFIELYGQTDGYKLEKCWIGTDKEYSQFQDKLAKWQRALSDYYDYYK